MHIWFASRRCGDVWSSFTENHSGSNTWIQKNGIKFNTDVVVIRESRINEIREIKMNSVLRDHCCSVSNSMMLCLTSAVTFVCQSFHFFLMIFINGTDNTITVRWSYKFVHVLFVTKCDISRNGSDDCRFKNEKFVLPSAFCFLNLNWIHIAGTGHWLPEIW